MFGIRQRLRTVDLPGPDFNAYDSQGKHTQENGKVPPFRDYYSVNGKTFIDQDTTDLEGIWTSIEHVYPVVHVEHDEIGPKSVFGNIERRA